MDKKKDKTPTEVPTIKTPHHPLPLKDPSSPSETNPINPKTDEPTKMV